MKKILFSIIISGLYIFNSFAQQTILITNSLGINRKAELVEVSLAALKVTFDKKSYVLKNNQNLEVGYQLIYNGNKKPEFIIFQADVKANNSTTYKLTEGNPTPVKAKTFGRFVPERKDDFAWENDFAAYRMYGPALAKENPSNGVDFWSKCTENLVVDQRYKDDIYNGISYHIDHGLGLDFYKVGHTLGCGGIAPYVSDSLWVGNQFDKYEVIEDGPLRSVFTLIYDSVKVKNEFYKETITITSCAGSLLNKAVVNYMGKTGKIQVGCGIFLHDGKGNLQFNNENGVVSYAEEAVSDFNVPAGRNYIGVYVPGKNTIGLKKGIHALILSDYKIGDPFTYYFGGGWSKWKFPTDDDWFKALNEYSEKIKNPLTFKLR